MKVSEIDKQRLYEAAFEASRAAYSPYSHFPVGAAVLVETGDIFAGCNVENASYGLTICAERNAVFQAVAKGNQVIRAVLVFTPTAKPSPPCGARNHTFGTVAEGVRAEESRMTAHALGSTGPDSGRNGRNGHLSHLGTVARQKSAPIRSNQSASAFNVEGSPSARDSRASFASS